METSNLINKYMDSNRNLMVSNNRSWTDVLEGLKITFKEWVREVVEDVVSEKMKLHVKSTPQYAYSGVELAHHLGCSKSTISRYKLGGKLDGCYTQIDRTIVYDLNKIDEKFKR